MQGNIRIGVFGTWRGAAYMKTLRMVDGAEVVAICDKNQKRIDDALEFAPEGVKICRDFDELLESGIDAVLLCNYFHEHAQFAIRALKKGIHVLSETMAAATPALCVALCRAVEESGCVYMLAENYPFAKSSLELKRVCEGGTLGEILFAEGEYVHPMSVPQNFDYSDIRIHGRYHWRRFMPVTYYCSHSIAPLMRATGLRPKKVIGKVIGDTPERMEEYGRVRGDSVGIMFVEMSNGAVFRTNGTAHMASHGNWFRISGTRGAIETIRGKQQTVRLTYNDWSIPEGAKEEQIYEPEWAEDAEKASQARHGGGDYWIVKHFADCVRKGKADPTLDVYSAVDMAAVGIFAWRSALNGSKEMKIPNFRLERVRKKWENDDLSPFPDENGNTTLPHCIHNRDLARDILSRDEA
jgi:predicted dehydrogenase